MHMNKRGLTLVELLITLTILSVLASLILPMAQMTNRRVKEIELRRNLREIRMKLDEFKRDYDLLVKVKVVGKNGYPETLQQLVEGYDFGTIDKTKRKYLRRIPRDPFNPPKPGEEQEWGLRAYTDEADSTSWGGDDVFDVYSLSEETAIDGTKYKDW
jgi:general secretion pathway protein G